MQECAGQVVLAVDGNSLVHRGYHALAHMGTRTASGAPIWAVRGLLMQLVLAVERVGASAVVVGFDDPTRSTRRMEHPEYKAHRAEKLPTLVTQLDLAIETLRELGIAVSTPPGLEADDVLSSVAATVGAAGGRTVVVTSDRDAFALISEHTRVLRIINGGVEASPLLTPDRLEILVGVRPEQYRDFAALRGDPSDNLPGVYGIGPKLAARLLTEFGTAATAFDDNAGVRERISSAVATRLAAPGAREAWERNCTIMTMHDDIPVDPAALPLRPDAVERAFRAVQLPGTVPRALHALSGIEPPAPTVTDTSQPAETLSWDNRAEWRARRPHPPLPNSRAMPHGDLQLTLF